jgi:hypothetical protein
MGPQKPPQRSVPNTSRNTKSDVGREFSAHLLSCGTCSRRGGWERVEAEREDKWSEGILNEP